MTLDFSQLSVTQLVYIAVLITLFSSLIILIRKKKYDAAIAVGIAIVAFVVMVFLIKRQ